MNLPQVVSQNALYFWSNARVSVYEEYVWCRQLTGVSEQIK